MSKSMIEELIENWDRIRGDDCRKKDTVPIVDAVFLSAIAIVHVLGDIEKKLDER